MRIIAGAWRGRPLAAPEGSGTRPTSDRAREGLFSMLSSRIGSLEGLHAADIFAGTGALGLEALSRGAAYCTFVEKDRGALSALQRNIAAFSAGSRTEVRAQAAEYASPPTRPCDVLFMDPPYATGLAVMALGRLTDPAWVAPGGWLSIETSGERLDVPAGFGVEAERRFGKTYILLLRKQV